MLILAGSSRQPAVSGNCLFPPAANAPGTRSPILFGVVKISNSAQILYFRKSILTLSLFTLHIGLAR